MPRSIAVLVLLVLAAAACGEDARPVVVPVVPAGAYEADCQRLCTIPTGDAHCKPKHAEFCVASCRARTNGLTPTCASCLIAAGSTIHGFIGATIRTDTGGPAKDQR
jgi:hypothetical protein